MRVRISDPKLPDGQEIALSGLDGLLINNQDVEITDEQVALYKARTGKDLADTIATSRKLGGTPKPKSAPVQAVAEVPAPPTTVVEPTQLTTDSEGGEN